MVEGTTTGWAAPKIVAVAATIIVPHAAKAWPSRSTRIRAQARTTASAATSQRTAVTAVPERRWTRAAQPSSGSAASGVHRPGEGAGAHADRPVGLQRQEHR